MNHLLLFYLFLSFAFGMVSLSTAGFCFHRYRNPIAHAFLWFYGAFSLVVLFKLLYSYGTANRLPQSLVFFFLYSESLVGKFALMFTLVYLIHRMVPVPDSGKRNAVAGTVAVFAFLMQNVTEYLLGIKAIDTLGDYFEDLVFLAFCFYCIWVGRRYGSSTSSTAIKILLRRCMWLFAITFPGLIYDMFLDDLSPIRVYPIMYCCTGLLFTAHFAKERNAGKEEAFDTLLAKAGISSREKQVIYLILEGLSNTQIAGSLFVSINTVKTHLRNIYRKLKIENRYQVMALAQESRAVAGEPSKAENGQNHTDG